MDTLISLLEAATKAGPLVLLCLLAGGLGYLLYLVVPKIKEYDQKYETITGNHLHDLPNIADGITRLIVAVDRLSDAMDRQERTLVALDSYTRARLNGGGNAHK